MGTLHVNSERGTVVVSVGGVSSGGVGGLFEVAPTKGSREVSAVERESDALLRLPLAPPLNVPVLMADFESSVSPRLAIVRAELLGVISLQLRVIGEQTYTRSSLFDLLDLSGNPLKPWISESEAERAKERKGKKAEGESPLPSFGGGEGGFGKLLASLAKARSIVEVGPAVIDGQQTTEFRAKLELTVKRPAGSALLGSTSSSKNAPKRLRETLHLYIASDGLPVRVADETRIGKARLDATVDTLATEIPVSVQPPPASETITKVEQEKQQESEARGMLEAESRPPSKREREVARRFSACMNRQRLPKRLTKADVRRLRKAFHECERIAKRRRQSKQ